MREVRLDNESLNPEPARKRQISRNIWDQGLQIWLAGPVEPDGPPEHRS